MPFDGKLLVKLICSSRAVRSAKGFGTLALGPDNRAGVFLKAQSVQAHAGSVLCSVPGRIFGARPSLFGFAMAPGAVGCIGASWPMFQKPRESRDYR